MDKPLRLLILENDAADTELMLQGLCRAGFHFIADHVRTEQEFRNCLQSVPDVVLADFNCSKFIASDALQILQGRGHDIPCIVVSGSVGEEHAALLRRQGAADYIPKDSLGPLGQAVRQAVGKKLPSVGVRSVASADPPSASADERRHFCPPKMALASRRYSSAMTAISNSCRSWPP